MSFKYLDNKRWEDISRDERHFCIDLLWQLKESKSEREFIRWINKECTLNLTYNFESVDYEVDVEVCYYRDLIFQHELSVGYRLENKLSIKGFLKRTFDICIFLPNDIIIIEAKAAKGMTTKQMKEFGKDKKAIKACHKNLKLQKVNVHLIALISPEYHEKLENSQSLSDMNKYFKEVINWKQIEKDGECYYKMPAQLEKIYTETNKISRADTFNIDNIVRDLLMIE